MPILSKHASVKLVGTNGQISLGKRFAGRQVLVDEQEPGVWLVRTVSIIPDNEQWLHEAQTAADLTRALDWSKTHGPSDADTDTVMQKLANGKS